MREEGTKKLFLGLFAMVCAVGLMWILPVKTVKAANEYAMFPMQYLNISNDEAGHNGRKIIDLCGKDAGRDNFYAPFSGKVVRSGLDGNSIIIQSTNPVIWADGTVDHVTLWIAHDDDISDIYEGKTFSQGEVIYTEGNTGESTGNHVHMVSARGQYTRLIQVANGKWTLENQTSAYNIFWLYENTVVKNPAGYTWKTLNGVNGVFNDISSNIFESLSSTNVSETEAQLNAELSKTTYLTTGGFYISKNADMSGMQKITETLNINVKSMWYGMNKWYGKLDKDTTYYWQMFAVTNGVEYLSPIQSFHTAGDGQKPNISNVRIIDLDSTGYTVCCDVTDNTGVSYVAFPTWTEANGQDDIASSWPAVYGPSIGNTYAFRVNISDHNNEGGTYITHIYAYDNDGNAAVAEIETYVTRDVPLTDFYLNNTTIDLVKNETQMLSVTGYVPEDTTANKNVSWKSSNTAIATVDSKGTVKAQKAGVATITGTIAGISKTCTVNVSAAPTFTLQPKNMTVGVGTKLSFTVEAIGKGLSYQWQYKDAANNSWRNSGAAGNNTEEISLTAASVSSYNGRQYRCIVTDKFGNKTTSNVATLYVQEALKITSQPVNKTVTQGTKVSFAITASGKSLSYQWQYKEAAGNTWKNSSASGSRTREIFLTASSASYDGRQYRCIVTDGYGKKVTSSAASLYVQETLKITSQPVNKTVTQGTKVSFAITVSGKSLSYQWQYKDAASNSWKNSSAAGNKTRVISLTASSASYDGRQYRCVVTDGYGKKVTSGVASLYVQEALKITSQPVNKTVATGTKTSFAVTATGKSLSYQWQYKDAASNSWKNSGAAGNKTRVISLTASSVSGYDGRQYRCIVTDGYGKKVTSSVASLYVQEALKITSQPVNKTVATGTKTSFAVTATGKSLSYQWQYKDAASNSWKNSGAAGNKTRVISLTASSVSGYDGRQYRCIVMDGYGKKVTSSVASLYVQEALKITSQPQNKTVAIGTKVSFAVTAKGKNLSYQWQYKDAASNSWKNSGAAGSKTREISLTASSVSGYDGRQYRCIVMDGYGKKVTSSVATLYMQEALK